VADSSPTGGWSVRSERAPRADLVRWDRRPFLSPLVDVADRGRATGLVLVTGERVRLLHWEGGRVVEPERSLYELELGDWREYAAYAMANPARGQQTVTHTASFEQRVEDWRRRFLRDAARATATRLGRLDWQRVIVAAEGQVAGNFMEALPAGVRERVVAQVEANPAVRGANDRAQAAFGVSKARLDLPSVDGSGTTTQVRSCTEALRGRDLRVHPTAEPSETFVTPTSASAAVTSWWRP
jgi:hypothetical protein